MICAMLKPAGHQRAFAPAMRAGLARYGSGWIKGGALAAGWLILVLGVASGTLSGLAADAGDPRTLVIAAVEDAVESAPRATHSASATALALRTAELALEEAAVANNSQDPEAARQFGEEARDALLPLLRGVGQSDLRVWRAAGRTAVLLQDPALAAAALDAIQRLQPDFAEDHELLDLLARLKRLPVQPYLSALDLDRASYLERLGLGPIPGLPYENSLGMRFVPVPGTEVLFSIWETRVQDYSAYAQANPGVNRAWENPVFGGVAVTPGPAHPVVNVSWTDAKAFCEWLTRKEQIEERLERHQFYRLPTDLEWSKAVGLCGEVGDTPRARNGRVPGVYPWGTRWPPPAGAGNYADLTAKAAFPSWEIIDAYRDGFATTAPVGSFPANPFGLYDLGGNVWEWCEDRYHPESEYRVVRGGSWFSQDPSDLLSSARDYHVPGFRYDCYGFRVVLVTGPER